MNELPTSSEDHYESGCYEIRLKGHLDARWADQFEHMRFTHTSDGTTILTGPIADQAALYGLLRKVRDLGLPLIALNLVSTKQANELDDDADMDHHTNKETNT